MRANELKSQITQRYSHVLFEYKGKNCGVDPLSEDLFNLWFGNELVSAYNIEDVMALKFFDGKSLSEIAGEIEIYE